MQILKWVPLLIGTVAAAVGIGAVFFPEKSSAGFGVKVTVENSVYVRTTGIRDVFIGLVFLYLYGVQNSPALCFVSLATALVSFTDFLITKRYGDARAWAVHLGATAFLIGYAVWLNALH